MEIKINIYQFDERFRLEYERLYECHDDTEVMEQQRRAIELWDEFIKDEKRLAFVRKYVEHRGDYLASDREVAAFMITLMAMMEEGKTE